MMAQTGGDEEGEAEEKVRPNRLKPRKKKV